MALPYNPYYDAARLMSVTDRQPIANASDIAPGQAFPTQAGGGQYSVSNPFPASTPTNPNLLMPIPSISSMKLPRVNYDQIPDYNPPLGWDYDKEVSNEQYPLPSTTPSQTTQQAPQQTTQNTVKKVQGGGFKLGNDAYDTFRIKKSGELAKLSQGQKADMAMAGAMGAVNLGVDLANIGSQKLNIGQPSTMYYAEGVKPTYQTGDYYNRAYNARPQGATGAEIASTGLKAAATGAQIAGPWGAAVGAAIGAGGALIAGGVRKRRQEREKQKALDLARAQQSGYNTRALDYSQQQTAQSEYARRTNPYQRMSNYYTA
jgi:hypothetical protein